MPDFGATPLEQLLSITVTRRKLSIGLPAPLGALDKRFPLTPEAAGMLAEKGYNVRIEEGAAASIHYPDIKYQQLGVDIVDRIEAFRSDIVISLSPLSLSDARSIRHGGLLFTLYQSIMDNPDGLAMLIRNGVTTIALDLIADEERHKPFADILAEISGRAAMAIASSLLADAEHGKGILLGGIAGIVPCEVTIIGSGIDACSAARSALGLGATVRMFDNDVYRLRRAMREMGSGIMGSALHPRVLLSALRSADVVVASYVKPACVISHEVVNEMKRGVITFDLTNGAQPVFPSLRKVDLGKAHASDNNMDGARACYVNPGNAVPRTVAMALSNSLLAMISEIFTCDGISNALMLNPGMQAAALTFMGKPVNESVAKAVGMRAIDIKLILQFS